MKTHGPALRDRGYRRVGLRTRHVLEGRSRQAAPRRALLKWFRLHARPLPWRKTKNPYAIWVSEVMLQQTQVARVLPFYRRFLRAFPTVASLARASRERVLELWSGLGYYRRAQHLHQAARILARKFQGRFPRHYHEVRSLPGVGDYTARAVLSIAYNLPLAALDGNVARVVARLRAIKGSFNQLRFRRAVSQELENLLSFRQAGIFNQALMELGQNICLPRRPRCPICPLRTWCEGYRAGSPASYPAPRPRRATEFCYLATAVLRRGKKVGLVRGLDEGLLGDLWNFPAAFGHSRADALYRLQEKLAPIAHCSILDHSPLGDLRHGITHRSIRVHLYPVQMPGSDRQAALRWFPLRRLDRAAISQLARKIAAQLNK